jgi:hypothetical protein
MPEASPATSPLPLRSAEAGGVRDSSGLTELKATPPRRRVSTESPHGIPDSARDARDVAVAFVLVWRGMTHSTSSASERLGPERLGFKDLSENQIGCPTRAWDRQRDDG